ncbi:helix-turn-helix domain-containing protein [Actinokineospora sp. G85]|uniref:helix-turn-helix domain-containing protein n=1 Tax=Actinokineospora sp. G85 TaxID=3406626 RepID=UPI003C70EBDE
MATRESGARGVRVLIISDTPAAGAVAGGVHRAVAATGASARRWDVSAPGVDRLATAARRALSLVVVASVRHNSFSGALKAALDELEPADVGAKPVGLVSVSEQHGAQALDHLRVVMGALGAVVIPHQLTAAEAGSGRRVAVFAESLSWFTTQLAPADEPTAAPPGGDLSPGVSRAVLYLRENFTDTNLSLDMVAKSVHLSRYHLSRTFRRETGQRFIDHVTHLRMTEARALLTSTQLTVTEICRRVGYHESSHFQRTFRNSFGMSPTEYRATGLTWSSD